MAPFLAVVAALLALAPAAHAAPRYAGAAAATITACRSDGFTATASVRAISARTRRPARIRGTRLQARLDALPLFGLPRPGQWRDLGRRSSGTFQENFAGLSFDTWTAVVRYRFRRGSRSVLSGDQRSEPRRIGRSRGRAFCIVDEGAKPRDARPPAVFLSPRDERWRRSPLAVTVSAVDDFSGVAQVVYRVNGGEWTGIRNHGTFELGGEGTHVVEASARDAAGNWAPPTVQTLRVDGGPPTTPALTLPPSVTAKRTPTISWGASSDSGSGVQGYHVAVKRPDGAIVASAFVGPGTTSIQSPVTLDDGTYTAEVTAFDGADAPWTSTGSLGFRVGPAHVTDVTPADGTDFEEDATPTFTLTLDRPADSETLDGVYLDRHSESGSDPVVSVICGNDACTTLEVTPASPLEEGRYALRVRGEDPRLMSREGTPFEPFAAAYSVTWTGPNRQSTSSNSCLLPGITPVRNLTTNDDDEDATVSFTASSSWTLEVLNGTSVISSASGAAGSRSHTFAMPLGDSSISFSFCGSSLSVTDIRGWREPRTPSFP